MTQIKGVDVSRWQGLIDWPRLKQNTGFAIIKIGGSDDGFYQDGQALRNVLEARAAGMPFGVYIYLGGVSAVGDEVNHIKNMVSNIGGLRPGEPLALDWEESNADQVAYVRGIAKGLIDAGFVPPLVYMNLNRVQTGDWSSVAALGCALWVAAWGNNDDTPDATPPSDEWPFWAIWQYSSVGLVPGIVGRVDLDIFNGSVEDFQKYGQKKTITYNAPINSSRVVSNVGSFEYTVIEGDNLSEIAKRWGRTWQELWTLNRDRVSNPDRIFPGLKLRVWSDPNPQKPTVTLAAAPPDNRVWHTVENGENLSTIAAKFGLPNWTVLYQANASTIGADPNLIRPGTRLVIP